MAAPEPRAHERDRLFMHLAMKLGAVTAERVDALMREGDASDAVPSARDLADHGVLDLAGWALVDRFVEAALAAHGGDARQALEALAALDAQSGETPDEAQLVFESFGGGLVAEEHAEEPPSSDSGAQPVFESFGGDLAPPSAEPDSQQVFASFGGEATEVDTGTEAVERGAPRSAAGDGEDDEELIPDEAPGRYRAGGADEEPGSGELGRGGMGRVLVAFDRAVGREVAVKELLLHGHPPSSGASRTTPVERRFLREARVTGQLEHPSIVPVHEIGRRQDGTLYYAMKIVRGRTLREALDDCDGLDDRLHLLGHFHDLCNAMAYAHFRGVVHRDLKPDNVMVGEFGETVLLDWGLAKARGQEDLRAGDMEREARALQAVSDGKTIDGQVLGTPAYMSPEQAEGNIDEIDERSDVWGLGAVLYQILTGRPPYEGVAPYEIVGKVIKDPVVPVRARCAEAPADLAAVAEKAMRHDREQRYADAQALAHEIDAYLHGRRVGAYEYSSWELLRRFVRQNKALSLGIAAVLLTVVVSSVVILLAYDREQDARSRAEQQEREAVEQRRSAQVNLARAYTNRAAELVAKRSHGEAYVYAAAALREAKRSTKPLPAQLQLELDSALYESRVRRTLALERTIPFPGRQLHKVAFSPDGRLIIAATEEGEISARSLDDAGIEATRKLATVAHMLRFTLDGKRLLVGCIDGTLHTLDRKELRELAVERLRAGGYYRFWSLSPDQRRVLLSDTKSPAWLVSRDRPDAAVSLGPGPLVAFSPDGQLIARRGEAGPLVLHDGQTGDVRATIALGPSREMMAFSPDGRQIAVHESATVALVDVERQAVVARIEGELDGVLDMAYPPGGAALWTAGGDGLVAWDAHSSNRQEVLWDGSAVAAFAISRDGSRVVTASRGALRVWRVRTRERVRSEPGQGSPINASQSRDGSLVAFGDTAGGVYLADRNSPERPTLLGTHATIVTDVALAPDGQHIASVANDFTLKLFRVRDRSEQKSLRLQGLNTGQSSMAALEYSPDGKRLVVAAPDGRFQILRSDSLELERFVDSSLGSNPTALRFTPDGRTLYAGDRTGLVACFDAARWQPVGLIRTGHRGTVMDIALSPDGRSLFTAGEDGWVRRFAVDSGKVERSWAAHEGMTNRISVSPDGALLVTGGDDRTAKLWDVSTGTLLRVLRFPNQVAVAMFSPDGASLLLGAQQGLEIVPQPLTLSLADADQALTEAMRVTGREISGARGGPEGGTTADAAGAEPARASAAGDSGASKPAPAKPNEIRGKLIVDWHLAGSAIADGTTLELLEEETEQPFTPPLASPVPPGGEVSFLLPEGVDRFAARSTMSGATSYQHSVTFARGATHATFRHFPLAALRHNARAAGVELADGTASIWGWVNWGQHGELDLAMPAGCVEITTDPKSRVYYGAPNGTVDPRLTRMHPRHNLFQLYNLEPGMHRLVARVGEHQVETNARARAGTITVVSILFDKDRFPDNPTPPRCFEEGSPEDVAWRGEP